MNQQVSLARRAFLTRTASIGGLALTSFLNRDFHARAAADEPARPRLPRWTGVVNPLHHRPRIRRVIHLYMAGGPSHLETLDYKPELARMHGRPMPESFTRGQPIAQLQGQRLTCFAPQHEFQRCGRSRQLISSIFPHIGAMADDLCIIRSLRTDQP